MRTQLGIGLSLIASFVLGGVAVHSLNAQTKPPVFYVAEVELTDQAGYMKEFVPKAQSVVASSGGRFLVQGGKTTPLVGEPPKRIVIQQWESLDQLQKWFNLPEQIALREIQTKYAKVRAFAVEGK
jgi:uncharacterized protein (DUF1330 family)